MKRWIATLAALMLLIGCAAGAMAEDAACEGWAVAIRDTEVRETPDPEGEVLAEVARDAELEYSGFTRYDEDHRPWYGVAWEEISGWIPGADAELKWSTLY